MEIINSNLKFTNDTAVIKPEGIILHHAAVTKCSIEDVHAWHLAKGWAGCGYQYLVRKDGSIYKGREENRQGAHAPAVNNCSIGICAEGDYTKEIMPEAQKQSIIWLIADIKTRHIIKWIKGHREVTATACPRRQISF